jgi:hypothetical protein
MARHPWHPRVAPFLVYILFLFALQYVRDAFPPAGPLVYTLQCGTVLWLLWRYRRLLPELTLKFHWLAVPVGVFVFVAWVWLRMLIDESDKLREMGLVGFTTAYFGWMIDPSRSPGFTSGEEYFASLRNTSVALMWAALVLRLLGMSIVVPMFEELFTRSLLLRSFHDFRRTGIGLLQIMQDLPGVGDWFITTSWGQRIGKHEPVFGKEFQRVPLGALSVFGVAASTFVFMTNHSWRDYPGTIACGIAYCLLLWATRHKGLGPVIWAHGITNALLWAYTMHTGDWRFL